MVVVLVVVVVVVVVKPECGDVVRIHCHLSEKKGTVSLSTTTNK